MNITCSIINDLLPLYIEGICSEDTKKMVELHLTECKECSQKYKIMTSILLPDESPSEETGIKGEQENEKEHKVNDFTAKRAFKKIRRLFIVTIVSIILAIPVFYLGLNQMNGEGISFTNMDEIFKASQMFKYIQGGNYEKAFTYIDVKGMYEEAVNPVKTSATLEETYTLVLIGETYYYVSEQILNNEYQQYTREKDENLFWISIYNSNNYVIPEEMYKKLIQENAYEDMYKDMDESPIIISCSYGNYYIPYQLFKSSNPENKGDSLLTQLAIVQEVIILPQKAYDTALTQVKEDRESENAYIKKMKDIGYENYYTQCKANFINNMKQVFERNIMISDYKLNNIYSMRDKDYDNDKYQLEYDLFINVNGSVSKGPGITLSTSNGKFRISGGYYIPNTVGEELEEKYHILSAFSVSEN